MGLQIEDYGRGLPDEFYDTLHDLFDEPPAGVQVGATVKSYSRQLAVRLVRFGTISVTENTGMGLVFDTSPKTFKAIARSGGKRGATSIELAVHQTETAVKDEFARGKALIISGNLAPRTLYIEGNTPTGDRVTELGEADTNGSERRLTLHFETPLPADITADILNTAGDTVSTAGDAIIIYAHKYMNCVVGTAGNRLPAGGSLTRSPASSKYAWMQFGGSGVGKASAAMATSVQDGTPLIKAAAGELALQPDTNLKKVIASIIPESAAIAANDLIPVEWSIGGCEF